MPKKPVSEPLLRAFKEWSEEASRRFQERYDLETKMFLKNIDIGFDWHSPLSITLLSIDSQDSVRLVPLSKIVKQLVQEANEDADFDDGPKILEAAAVEFERHAKALRAAAKKLSCDGLHR